MSAAGSGDPVADGAALARGWLEGSPFVAHLGITLEAMGTGHARLRLPFSPRLPTLGDVVHGGAISTLVDTAAAAAAWSGATVPERPRASTVGLAISFLAPARGHDVIADARVIRAGQVSVIEVTAAGEDGAEIARALVTYRL